MTTRATGPFDVKLTPQPFEGGPEGVKMGRMTIDKQFRGELEGTSKGQMLSAGTDVGGSAGYVAIEHVTGTLHGRNGTFVLASRSRVDDEETRAAATVFARTARRAGISHAEATEILYRAR